MVLADNQIERALVVVAHPDDADFWAGGTVAGWTSAGIAVTYCVLSDGDSGGFDPQVSRSAIPGIRRAEQEAAAAVLGVTEVRFVGYPDGCIEPSYALRRDITRVIRQVQPIRMLTWSPEWSWRPFHRNHPDHRAAGEATLSAIFPDARNPFAHPELLDQEGLKPWEVGEVWLLGSPNPNHYVDISDLFDRKLAALRAHQSQTAHRDRLAEEMRERLAPNSQAAGLPADHLAEAFQVGHDHLAPGALTLPGAEHLAGLLGEVVRRLVSVRADELHEARHIVHRSPRPKPWHLRKRLPTDRACALKVALLGVGAGKDGVTLHARPQVGWVAELDRLDREPLRLAGPIKVAEAACQVPCEPALIEIDPRGVLRRV